MKSKKILFRLVAYVVCFAVGGWAVMRISRPVLRDKAYETKVYSYKSDSTMLGNGRQCGDINLDKFIELASKKPKSVFDPSKDISRHGDSITFSTTSPSIFFGVDGGGWWKEHYGGSLPVSFPDEHSFRAAVHRKDTVEYIFIPYQILSCLADSFNEIQESGASRKLQQSVSDSITIHSMEELKTLPHDGSKIQTGGIVFQHVSDVLQDWGGNNKNSREQLEILWRYARNKWLYIHDPYTGTDTWRSASETIEAYYFTQKKGYSGDCDDFAILMASFARQLGFDSHIVVALGKQGGHAYAEFKDGGQWVPMDWFSNRFGGKPYDAFHREVLSDI